MNYIVVNIKRDRYRKGAVKRKSCSILDEVALQHDSSLPIMLGRSKLEENTFPYHTMKGWKYSPK
jgi:hypothetical protein